MSKRWMLMTACVFAAVVGVCSMAIAAGAEARDKKAEKKETGKMVFADPSKDPTKPAVGGVRWFWPTHNRNYARRKAGNIDLVFLGDSITQGWPGDLFGKYYGNMNAVNFGCGGDKIQHVLMRLDGDDGELKGTTPKVVVLMIGVNNMGDNTAEEIAYGVDFLVKRIREDTSKAKILLLGILPGKGGRDDKVVQTNKLLARLDDGKTIRFLDMGSRFLDKDGKALEGVHSDAVHLTGKGYQIWAETMNPVLLPMMGRQSAPSAGGNR